jgi:hypothetical protein
MSNYLVTVKSGPHIGRSFAVENVANDADAYNKVFEILGKESIPLEEYTKMKAEKLPLDRQEQKQCSVFGMHDYGKDV